MKKYCDTRYLRSVAFAVKIFEIILLSGAWITVFLFDKEVIISGTVYSRLQFFVLVTLCSFVFEFIVFMMISTRITRNLPVPWPWVNLVLGVMFGLFVLVASAFLGNSIIKMKSTTKAYHVGNRKWEQLNECEYLHKTRSNTSCLVLELGVVFGILSVVALIADIHVSTRDIRSGKYQQEPPTDLQTDESTLS